MENPIETRDPHRVAVFIGNWFRAEGAGNGVIVAGVVAVLALAVVLAAIFHHPT